VALAVAILARVKEPERWQKTESATHRRARPIVEIFDLAHRQRTIVNATLVAVAIIGLWAAAVYEPTAVITLARKAGMGPHDATQMASFATSVLSIGTILGCLALPPLAGRFGRRPVLAGYFLGMGTTIAVGFGVVFYLPNALGPFIALLFVLGFFGGSFTMFSLWLPEQYATRVRATAFAFATSAGRFVGAGVNFLLGWMVAKTGTLGFPVACTSIAFFLGVLVIPFALETRGKPLPE
jgi:MFS family permease